MNSHGEVRGYTYHASMKRAKAYIKEHGGEISDTAPTPKTKDKMLQLLNYWGGHTPGCVDDV